MQEIWAILDQWFPFLFRSLNFSKEHSLMERKDKEDGRPSSGKDWSLSQQLISSLLCVERCWSPMLSRNLRSINPLIRRELRFLGSNFSFGNDSMFSHLPSISKWLRQSNLCSPHSFPSMSLSQKVTQNKLRLEGQPPSGCDSSSGHLFKNMDWRFLRVCNWSGRFLRFLQLDNQMDIRLGVGNTPFGKYTRLGQSLISKASRDVRSFWISTTLKGNADLHKPR